MRFRLKGRIPPDDPLHQVAAIRPEQLGPLPDWVYVPGIGLVPKYAPTMVGENAGYDPAGDCCGYFTSSKYQVHNNCYNYALDIVTNTMAQPGRMRGLSLPGDIDPDWVVCRAQQDGLILAGGPDTTLADL